MKQLLSLQDLLPILKVSEPTLRRWLAESRVGRGNFPRSVNAPGKKLLFRPEDIEAWASAGRPAPVAVEPASLRSKRHATAMKRLQSKGVRVANSKPHVNKKT